jgi:CubicO group peptidase (beta-lactamase class C family)
MRPLHFAFASTTALLAGLGLPACAAAPLCARPPDAGFAYPAGAEGSAVAEYVRAFDSGDWRQLHAFSERHRSPAVHAHSAEQTEASYVRMRDGLGCIEPRALSVRDGTWVLLVETAREGYYEVAFRTDADHRIESIRGMPAFGPGENEPASLDDATAIIDRYVTRLAADERFSGLVAVADHGAIVWHRELGMADRGGRIPNQLATSFNIASIGKMFTGVAVAQLVEQKKLRFDETIGEVLPAYPLAEARAITIDQLLTHTSGLGDNDRFLEAKPPLRTPADFIAHYARVPLLFPPGEGNRYSNYGFEVLARLIEVASGEAYDAYLAAHLYGPAGMRATGGSPPDDALRAIPYTRRAPFSAHGERTGALELLPPAGGFGAEWATAEDLVRFGDALFGGKLVSPAMARFITTAKVPSGPPTATGTIERGYAYGFGEDRLEGARVVAHEGGTFGASAVLGFLPDAGITLVVLANDDPPAGSRVGGRAQKILAYVAAHAR